MSREFPAIKVTLCNEGLSGGRAHYVELKDITGIQEDTYSSAKGWKSGCSVIWVNTEDKSWRVEETEDEIAGLICSRLIKKYNTVAQSKAA